MISFVLFELAPCSSFGCYVQTVEGACMYILIPFAKEVASYCIICFLHVISFVLFELAPCSSFGCYMQSLEGDCVCTILSPLQKCSFSLHEDTTHVDNQVCCYSSICTTSSVPQILLLARALSSEAAMQNHRWLSPSIQLLTALSLCPTCQGTF